MEEKTLLVVRAKRLWIFPLPLLMGLFWAGIIFPFLHSVAISLMIFVVMAFACMILLSEIAPEYDALTVTDRRIFGKTQLGRRVSFPLESISAVSAEDLFSAMKISTSSGSIKFWFVSNANEGCSVINDLISERAKR